jgi:hypothetical protein
MMALFGCSLFFGTLSSHMKICSWSAETKKRAATRYQLLMFVLAQFDTNLVSLHSVRRFSLRVSELSFMSHRVGLARFEVNCDKLYFAPEIGMQCARVFAFFSRLNREDFFLIKTEGFSTVRPIN